MNFIKKSYMDPLYVEAIQKAVDDYNDWATKKGADYDIVRAYNELKGIFYNKFASYVNTYTGLRRGSRNSYLHRTNADLLHILPTTQVFPTFTQGGYIVGLAFNFSTGESYEVTSQLRNALKGVVFDRDPFLCTIKESYRRIANYKL